MVYQLQRWNRGDQLSAEQLNGNFATLFEMAAMALSEAHMPDAAVAGLEMAQGRLAQRVEGLEKLTAMHAHQRNEKQYAPLSTLGSVIVMVNDLRQDIEKAIARTDDLYARLRAEHDDLHARLVRLEQQADAADKELLAAVARDDKRFAVDAGAALAQIVEPRHGDAQNFP